MYCNSTDMEKASASFWIYAHLLGNVLAGMHSMGQKERQSYDLGYIGLSKAVEPLWNGGLVHIEICSPDRAGMFLADHLGQRFHQLSIIGQAGAMPKHKYSYVLHENTSITFD